MKKIYTDADGIQRFCIECGSSLSPNMLDNFWIHDTNNGCQAIKDEHGMARYNREFCRSEKMEIRITVRCEKDDSHAKILKISHGLGSEYAKGLAGLLDGSSPFYIHKPGPKSPIGKCCICQGKLSAEVEEVHVAEKVG